MKPGLGTNRFGTEIIGMGMGVEETYGGKLTENIVQAAALDLLAEAITRIEESGGYRSKCGALIRCFA